MSSFSDSLQTAEATVEATRAVLQAMIEELRQRKVSWEAIGKALGISRQAAWERFRSREGQGILERSPTYRALERWIQRETARQVLARRSSRAQASPATQVA